MKKKVVLGMSVIPHKRAITKGQSIVFYKNDIVIGGGTIKKVY